MNLWEKSKSILYASTLILVVAGCNTTRNSSGVKDYTVTEWSGKCHMNWTCGNSPIGGRIQHSALYVERDGCLGFLMEEEAPRIESENICENITFQQNSFEYSKTDEELNTVLTCKSGFGETVCKNMDLFDRHLQETPYGNEAFAVYLTNLTQYWRAIQDQAFAVHNSGYRISSEVAIRSKKSLRRMCKFFKDKYWRTTTRQEYQNALQLIRLYGENLHWFQRSYNAWKVDEKMDEYTCSNNGDFVRYRRR